jgi:hypothetical protein
MFCPKCGSIKVDPTVFGIPLPTGLGDIAKGVFGEAEWKCKECGYSWSESDFKARKTP